MDYGMIGKIEKAKRYAEERERFNFTSFSVDIKGENNQHSVTYDHGEWTCTCSFFATRGRCSHTIALEFILKDMLAEEAPEA